MNNTIITADSGVIINDDEIPTIPLVVIDTETGKEYLDQTEISVEQVYELRRQGHRLTTSCMNLFEAKEFFKRQLEKFDHVVHLCISDKVSRGSYQVAVTAADEVAPDRIRVINTNQGGSGGLFVAKKALDALKQMGSAAELIQYIERVLVPHTKTAFLVPDPSGYKRSGKGMLNGIINLGLSALSSTRGLPLIKLTSSGALVPFKILKCSDRDDMYTEFLQVQYNRADAQDASIAIAYLSPEPGRLQRLRDKLDGMDVQAMFAQMGGVIASYACQDTLGISYLQSGG